MFILLEKADSRGGDDVENFDAMGTVNTEAQGIEWTMHNPRFRRIKYCPETTALKIEELLKRETPEQGASIEERLRTYHRRKALEEALEIIRR